MKPGVYMNEKKIKLIEAGMKLFAERGFHMTSVEAIADGAGVSKGAFYLHFQSKQDFIMTAFHHYYEAIANRIESVQKENLAPRDSFAKQIEVVTKYIYQYKDFLTMHIYQNMSTGENTDTLIRQMNAQNVRWLWQNISHIYGDRLEPYYPDMIIQLEGLVNAYFKWIIIDGIHINRNQLGPYIVRRMDDIVSGLMERGETPLVTADHIPNVYWEETSVIGVLIAMKTKIDTLGLPEDQARELKDVIAIMLDETGKEHPQKAIIQGLLVHFQRIPEFAQECQELARLLHIDLLD
ncbi:helix-turn-helix domain-containing protein [Lentibacillus sp.]|uniref:TetR/AcrR family transcriptional regulator n=1 Tax=Lentibacillus sp. TaxID=1925746 RepID=UPI002B4AD038|nr:helix-turn-helix domain-containing protein [Lentibacillus sp.]HLS09901.1 helix-turn-helix domain-containing protein [Lentibacillus sp.]